MSMKGFCKTNVVTVTPDISIIEAAALMRDRNVGNVVVVDTQVGASKPIGLLTDRDIVIDSVASGAKDLDQLKVEDLMTRDPVCARDDEGIYEVALKMRQEAVGRMPIVDEKGHLCGIITSKNILALLNDELTELVSIADAQKQSTGRAGKSAASKSRATNDAAPVM